MEDSPGVVVEPAEPSRDFPFNKAAFDDAAAALYASHMQRVVSCVPSNEVCVLCFVMLTCDNLTRWRRCKKQTRKAKSR